MMLDAASLSSLYCSAISQSCSFLGECCTQIELVSSFSSGAAFDQGDRLGQYEQGGQMADGKYVYEQVFGNQYLYYMQVGESHI